MSYHIYTTKGIVLSFQPLWENDRVYNILTRDLGLLRATVLGARKESSKLRGNLEPYSLVQVSLVRGKEYWRATSGEFISKISVSPFVARPLSLIEKLVQGEMASPELFSAVEEALFSDVPRDEMFEVALVSKILFNLGYLKESDLNLDKKSLIAAINSGLEASHL